MIETEINVRWGEMDAFGHVNNVQYFRYMEVGRIEYFSLSSVKPFMTTEKAEGIGPILKKIDCIYNVPVNYPAQLVVKTSVTSIGNTSLKIKQQICDKETNDLVAEGESIVVLFNYSNQHPVTIPADLVETFEKLEGKKLSKQAT